MYRFELLMMSRKTARNTQSVDNNKEYYTTVMPGITTNLNRMSRQALTMVARPNCSEQNQTKTVCHQSEKSDIITGSLDGNSGQYKHHTITPTV
jgi:hypothetical protein